VLVVTRAAVHHQPVKLMKSMHTRFIGVPYVSHTSSSSSSPLSLAAGGYRRVLVKGCVFLLGVGVARVVRSGAGDMVSLKPRWLETNICAACSL